MGAQKKSCIFARPFRKRPQNANFLLIKIWPLFNEGKMARTSQNFADYLPSSAVQALGIGRVDLMSSGPSSLNIPSYVTAPSDNSNYSREAVSKQTQRTPLSDLYFSCTNIDAVQDAIRYQVFVQTKLVVGRQSDAELKIVMRGVFLQHGRNNPNDIVGQVRELNGKVLEYAVPEVVSNLLQYQKYIVDASTMPMPLDRAPIATMKGSRTLNLGKTIGL
jgi:hypothetical protein